MAATHTRPLLALWGQRLHGYLPPYSPAGLIGGQVLLRYPVTGSTCATTTVSCRRPTSLDQLHAYVSSTEWKTSAAPVEVVCNANECQPLHSLTPADPEDVRRCTEYLVRKADAAFRREEGSVLEESPQRVVCSPHHAEGGAPALFGASSAGAAAVEATSLWGNGNAGIQATLQVLTDVVREHCNLLAGAESLQTGIPLAFLLKELEEAVMYLQWSCTPRHTLRVCVGSAVVNTASPSQDEVQRSQRHHTVTPLSSSVAKKELPSCTDSTTERKAGATPDLTSASSSKEGRERLRSSFESEVACLQHQLQHHVVAALSDKHRHNSNFTLSSSTEPLSSSAAKCDTALYRGFPRYTLPLITVMTSTHNGLASALKATAVVWAAEGDQSDTCVRARQVMWRPAPDAALVAAWLAVLLRRHTQRHVTGCRGGGDVVDHDPAVGGTPAAVLSSQTERVGLEKGENYHHAAGASSRVGMMAGRKVEGAAGESRLPAWTTTELLFNVLLTGGDTERHLVKPWCAGVANAKVMCGAALDASGEAAGAKRRSSLEVGDGVLMGDPLWLCYGCPAMQVGHLRSLLSSSGAAQSVGGGMTSGAVVELRTEVPTTGLILTGVAATHLPRASQERVSSLSPTPTEHATQEQVNVEGIPAAAAAASRVARQSTRLTSADGTQKTQLEESSMSQWLMDQRAHSAALPGSFAFQSTLVCTLSAPPRQACCSAHSSPNATPQPPEPLADVARELFRRSVLEPPFLCSSKQMSSSHLFSESVLVSTASGDGSSSSSASASATFSFPLVVPGWCSLWFVPQHCAAPLLRLLVQRHWRQPWYIGHSLDTSSLRGPAPSVTHTQMIQDMVRYATKGTDARAGAASLPSHDSAGSAAVVFEATSRTRLRWRHGCGGFPLPLTATPGRGSPYVLPGLLFTDLTAAMAEEERERLLLCSSMCEGEQRKQKAATCSHLPAHGAAGVPLPFSTPLHAAPSANKPLIDGISDGDNGPNTDELHAQVREAARRATRAVQRDVADIMTKYETAAFGYRGVVGGNVLFLCRYPDHLENAVREAAMGVLRPDCFHSAERWRCDGS